MALRTTCSLAAVLLLGSLDSAAAAVAALSPEGALLGPSTSAYSPDRKEAWVNLTASGYTEPLWRLEPLVLTHETRIFYVHDLFTDAECSHLLARVRNSFERSAVVDRNGTGLAAFDPIRNSEGAWINRRSDSVMSRINDRISLLTHLPVSHQEDMQILKYEVGQHYHPHSDFFDTSGEMRAENGGQRWITILGYLNDYGKDYTGGETIFPVLPEGPHQAQWRDVTNCTQGKLAVRPKKGDAVMFYSLSTDLEESGGSSHGSCDVLSGTKYSSPVWIRQNAFHLADLPPEGPIPCRDKEDGCKAWQQNGECERNPGYMLKSCMKSCGVCTGDWL
jgi:prolyl 4-hydroxylase